MKLIKICQAPHMYTHACSEGSVMVPCCTCLSGLLLVAHMSGKLILRYVL